jgi:hypothetical protein
MYKTTENHSRFMDSPPRAHQMLRSMGIQLGGERTMRGIEAYEKSAKALAIKGKNGKVPAPAAVRQGQVDRAARILRLLVLSARTANQPFHHDGRGILFDTYG